MRLVAPMLATRGELLEAMDRGWAAEVKYDGCRILDHLGSNR